MSEDSELERLKAKRLAEMQKNISSHEQSNPAKTDKTPAVNPRESLISKLGFRGLEVLENAESQFPNETRLIIDKLFELIKSGEIIEVIDGGKLLTLFRSVGMNIRMATKINVEHDGAFVSLSDKLRNQNSENSDE